MTEVKIIDSEDEHWTYGHTKRYDDKGNLEATTHWVKISDADHKKYFWMLQPPEELFDFLDVKINKENADYIQKIFEEDWTSGVYWFIACLGDIKPYGNDVAKLILNEISFVAKERNIDVKKLYHPLHINQVCKEIFVKKRLDKKHFKEVIERLQIEEMDDILLDPAYAKVDDSFLDEIIDRVVKENAAKNDGTEKIVNWFIGQVMKETKGKASAAEVREKLKTRL